MRKLNFRFFLSESQFKNQARNVLLVSVADSRCAYPSLLNADKGSLEQYTSSVIGSTISPWLTEGRSSFWFNCMCQSKGKLLSFSWWNS